VGLLPPLLWTRSLRGAPARTNNGRESFHDLGSGVGAVTSPRISFPCARVIDPMNGWSSLCPNGRDVSFITL